MTITKFGHCCLLIEDQGIRILTDPGMFSSAQDQVTNLDAVLITHEHADHFHVESVKNVIKNNPKMRVITNTVVAELLKAENISTEIVEHGQSTKIGEVTLEAFGEKHAQFHSSIPQSTNTGYLISEKLFFPGDAFTNPSKKVEVLALPVAGPWLKLGEALDYALEVEPKVAFAVHDAVYVNPAMVIRWIDQVLPKHDIQFKNLELGKAEEFDV